MLDDIFLLRLLFLNIIHETQAFPVEDIVVRLFEVSPSTGVWIHLIQVIASAIISFSFTINFLIYMHDTAFYIDRDRINTITSISFS